MVSNFFFFQRKKGVAYKSVVWLTIVGLFFGTTPVQAVLYTGGEGDGYSASEGIYLAPAKLAFTVQPGALVAGQVFVPAPVVQVQASDGTLIDEATNTITLAILNNPSSGTLSGTTSMDAVGGVADFADKGLSIDNAGALYTLQASASGLTSAISDALTLVPSDVSVKSELTYDSGSGTYLINSWLESKGEIMAGGTYAAGDISITIYDKNGTALTGGNVPGTATVLNDSVFRQSWTPPSEKDAYIAKIVILYKGRGFSTNAAYNPHRSRDACIGRVNARNGCIKRELDQ